MPYWSNPPFIIFDIWALSPERQSARMSKIINGGLDQYGAGPLKQQQFGTAGVGGVNNGSLLVLELCNKIGIVFTQEL